MSLRRMNEHGRIVCCGVVSQYDTSNPAGAPTGIPGLLVNKRIRMEGFLVFDYTSQYEQARAEIKGWITSGQLTPLNDEIDGLEKAPAAFVDLLAGGNVGTRIIRVAS
jgi:NADPH-dependent curcumin reductase CurA